MNLWSERNIFIRCSLFLNKKRPAPAGLFSVVFISFVNRNHYYFVEMFDNKFLCFFAVIIFAVFAVIAVYLPEIFDTYRKTFFGRYPDYAFCFRVEHDPQRALIKEVTGYLNRYYFFFSCGFIDSFCKKFYSNRIL